MWEKLWNLPPYSRSPQMLSVLVVIVIAGRAREPEVDVAIFTHISGTRSALFRQLPTDSCACVCVCNNNVLRKTVRREKFTAAIALRIIELIKRGKKLKVN